MTISRRIARRLYSRSLSLFLQVTTSGVRALSPREVRHLLGQAQTLRIAAAGASVQVSDKLCSLDDCDVLGVNYFSTCTALRLWQKARFFVIEPHETYWLYLASLRRLIAEKGTCFVIVKGFGSPSKMARVTRLVRALSAIPGVTVLLSEDRYIADLDHDSYAEAIVSAGGKVVSGAKTILWTLSFAYAAGYRKVILHGFDFSDAYAYPTSKEGADEKPKPNHWVKDSAPRTAILKEIAHLHALFAESGIALEQCGCDGPLPLLLPADTSSN